MRQPEYSEGLLAFVFRFDSLHSIDVYRLQRILLVYYRILHANVDLPRDLHWPLEPLARLIWTPHPDNGVRFLAIRCYALHTGMIEGERVKVEKEMIGDVTNIDCPIAFGESLDGTRVVVDGWIMPMLEVTRIFDARNAHLEPQDYYVYENNDSTEPIHPAELRYDFFFSFVLSC